MNSSPRHYCPTVSVRTSRSRRDRTWLSVPPTPQCTSQQPYLGPLANHIAHAQSAAHTLHMHGTTKPFSSPVVDASGQADSDRRSEHVRVRGDPGSGLDAVSLRGRRGDGLRGCSSLGSSVPRGERLHPTGCVSSLPTSLSSHLELTHTLTPRLLCW